MAADTLDRTTDLISLDEGVRLSGLSWHTLRRRLAAHNVQVYLDPIDSRRRVFERAALDRIVQLRPARRVMPGREGEAA